MMDFTVLISVYSINPYRGFDAIAAWNIIKSLDHKFQIVVVTHFANRKDIEHFLANDPEAEEMQVKFKYFSLPSFPGFRQTSPPRTLLHQYLWNWRVVRFIRNQKIHFDVAHHLNYPCGCCPTFLWALDKPFIWGPVGYNSLIPQAFLKPYGWITFWKEQLRWRTKTFFWPVDPFVRATKEKAAHIFTINRKWTEHIQLVNSRASVMPIVVNQTARASAPEEGLRVVAGGSFVARSGFDIVVRSFTKFYFRQAKKDRDRLQLTLIGDGPQTGRLKKLIQHSKVPEKAISLVVANSIAEMEPYLEKAQVFFYPSHETISQITPIPLSYGLPLLCFKDLGAGCLLDDACSLSVTRDSYENSVFLFSKRLEDLYRNPALRERLSYGARQKFQQQFSSSAKADEIAQMYWNVFHRGALGRLRAEEINKLLV